MSAEALRPLLYPLGLLATFLFGLRFLLQWIHSERNRASLVTPLFWVLSLSAHSLMGVHGLVQLQYPVCLIQVLNAVIAWRHLDVRRPSPRSRKTTVQIMCLAAALVTLFFAVHDVWMRTPTLPWNLGGGVRPTWGWHLLGCTGMALFASRFWVQWWLTERHQSSHLGRPFWLISLVGALCSLAYFTYLFDPVLMIGYGLGLLPYVRNLMLLKKRPLPSTPAPTLYLFAGEASGDLLGGRLIEALRRHNPEWSISGVGGVHMRSTGMEITHPMEHVQVMGFSSVLTALPRLYRTFRAIKTHILTSHPAGVVLIDSPDFTLPLAQALRRGGYRGKLIHYVCPSIWAWRKNRMHSLVETLDGLLSILPFERDLFKMTSLSVTYVGHPLVSAVDSHVYDLSYPLPTDRPILALFPGSRRHEIARNLPLQWEAAQLLSHYTPVISVAHPDLVEIIRRYVPESVPLVPQEKRYELMRASTLALATSGTIVLEIGLHALPAVVTYRLSSLDYLLGRYLFRIHLPHYTLVNIICGREVFPEWIGLNLKAAEIAKALNHLDRKGCQKACRELRARLSDHDASQQAASTIEKILRS